MTREVVRSPAIGHALVSAALAVAGAAPAAMVLSRGVAPVLLAIAAVMLMLAAGMSGRADDARSRVAGFARSPAGFVALAAAAYMGLSLLWTPALARGAEFTGHVLGSAILAAAALGSLAATPLGKGVRSGWLAALVAASVVLVLIELQAGSPVRSVFGGGQEAFRLNRAAVGIALFLPLSATLLVADGYRVAAGLLGLSAAAAVFASQSESAKLALLVALAAWLPARFAPRLAPPLLGAAVIGSLLAAPAIAPAINALIPQALHEAVGYGTLGIRGEIWTRYAWLVAERPIFGYGMEASHVTAQVLAGTLDTRDLDLLDFGHTHNFALQVWFELGLIGVTLAAALLVLSVSAVSRAPARLRPAALATAAAVWAVAFVSHGAWQAWWWCLVGLLALLFAASARGASKHGID